MGCCKHNNKIPPPRRGFLHWLLRTSQPAAPAGTTFGYLEQGAYRTEGTIPRAAIAACERVNEPVQAWCRRHGIAPVDTLVASPLDKPNTVLILHDDCPARLTHRGVPRESLACVFLYVDRPDALAAALRQL